MNRGSADIVLGGEAQHWRFNEAPIHESGKLHSGGHARGPLEASMRPRFMNRGSVGGRGKMPGEIRSFNEAPIHESGK